MFASRAARSLRPSPAFTSSCVRRPLRTPLKPISIVQSRQASTIQRTKALWKKNPFSVTAAFAAILFGAGTLMYANYVYQSYIVGAFHKFPEPVAKQLRKALYFTNISLEPKNALKYYKEALRVADEVGMDPFSDEIIGTKIQLAAFLEMIQQFEKAISVLEIVRADNLKWIDMMGAKPEHAHDRTRILGKTVGISVKLGELYANEYVKEKGLAEERLVWAVETVLKEQRRREVEGVKPDEGQWLSPEEIGGSLEALGHHYEEKDQHYLAAPLFLQAINLSPPKSCHTAILMNNLSISVAQQDPPLAQGQKRQTRETLVKNAQMWAQKSLAVASQIQPPERTEECDVGCAVATHNLGEFAEMLGKVEEARKRYEEAKSLAKAVGFEEGLINSEAALRRLGTG